MGFEFQRSTNIHLKVQCNEKVTLGTSVQSKAVLFSVKFCCKMHYSTQNNHNLTVKCCTSKWILI